VVVSEVASPGSAAPETDEWGFDAFVQARAGALLRTASLLLGGSWQDAEDVVQAALEKAFRHWRRVAAGGDPEAYVRRIVVNMVISRARRRRVLQEIHMARPPETPVRPGTDALDDRDLLLAELDRLPARQRAVLVLRYWEDLSEEETARILGCSTGTVKSQASRGLARIRQSLGAQSGREASHGR
jgi:RNA polymerase sigma-70 factor (sigma-E family)